MVLSGLICDCYPFLNRMVIMRGSVLVGNVSEGTIHDGPILEITWNPLYRLNLSFVEMAMIMGKWKEMQELRGGVDNLEESISGEAVPKNRTKDKEEL